MLNSALKVPCNKIARYFQNTHSAHFWTWFQKYLVDIEVLSMADVASLAEPHALRAHSRNDERERALRAASEPPASAATCLVLAFYVCSVHLDERVVELVEVGGARCAVGHLVRRIDPLVTEEGREVPITVYYLRKDGVAMRNDIQCAVRLDIAEIGDLAVQKTLLVKDRHNVALGLPDSMEEDYAVSHRHADSHSHLPECYLRVAALIVVVIAVKKIA